VTKAKQKRLLIGAGLAVLGGALGYAYYATVGCASGGCAITSNPFLTTAFGAVMAVMVGLPAEKPEPQKEAGDADF
jgi:hypothetical protein